MKLNLLVLALFFLASCTSLKDIDKPVCVEISMSRGYCTTIISGKGFYVDDQNKMEDDTWFGNRPKMILVPVSTWAALKKYLIMNCKRSKQCNANIDSWNRSMDDISSKLGDKVPFVPEQTNSSPLVPQGLIETSRHDI